MSDNASIDQAHQDRIRDKAYELWQKAGFPERNAEHFWQLAEREVKADERNYEKDYGKVLMDSFPASDPPANSGFTS